MNKKGIGLLVGLLIYPLHLYALEPLVGTSTDTHTNDVIMKPVRHRPKEPDLIAPDLVLPGEKTRRKNYVIPAIEIPSFLLLLNAYDRVVYPDTVYNSNLTTFKDHLIHGHWTLDQDPFGINQFGHPFQGAMMYGFARSTGLNFYESLLYSNVGEFLWKMGGENGPIGLEDQITTAQAGSIFGEELYRMASLVLERGGQNPEAWREWCAAFISPPTGINRFLFGDRFREIESRRPATAPNLRLGVDLKADARDDRGFSRNINDQLATIDYRMEYGLPGKPGYRYLRPLDYFAFELKANFDRATPFELFMTRGLLMGKKYEYGDSYRGVWGVYGSYDYLAPQLFHASSTGASLGTTGQLWLTPKLALQGTGMGGVGLGASGSIDEELYHYGVTPQALLALRLIMGDRIMLDSTVREYYVAPRGWIDTDRADAHGNENIVRIDSSINYRIYGPHAISLQYVYARRDAHYSNLGDRHQRVGTIGIAYSYLWYPNFGAVEWGRN